MIPALLTRISIWPNSAFTFRIISSTSSRTEMSHLTGSTSAPSARNLSVARFSSCSSRAQITSRAPRCANCCAIASPSPRELPVISTTRPRTSSGFWANLRQRARPTNPAPAPTPIPAAAAPIAPTRAARFKCLPQSVLTIAEPEPGLPSRRIFLNGIFSPVFCTTLCQTEWAGQRLARSMILLPQQSRDPSSRG